MFSTASLKLCLDLVLIAIIIRDAWMSFCQTPNSILALNLLVKIGFGYLNGGLGFLGWEGPWMSWWWWPWAMGWNLTINKVDTLILNQQQTNYHLTLTMPVPRPMNRFWKYLQGEVHIAFLVGQGNWDRQDTNCLSHSHSSWLHLLPPFLLSGKSVLLKIQCTVGISLT